MIIIIYAPVCTCVFLKDDVRNFHQILKAKLKTGLVRAGHCRESVEVTLTCVFILIRPRVGAKQC